MASQEPVVIVRDLHKDFVLPQHKNTSIKQTVVNITRKNGKTTQRVLDGISFEVNKGDFFGIVGRNGSGKSTLLKILAGVYTPTSGGVEIRGGLTPFIELGVGFNPELSGRDNVFLNGALLGFSRKEMAVMYDEIVDFAELEPFMDQKLKNYSSGMQVRLAFSIAIKAHNEILIFDEVLAVGDEAFQRKCLDVFEQYKANKQTVILVTHDMETVKQFCSRAVLIDQGKIIKFGGSQEVADDYSRLNQKQIDQEAAKANQRSNSSIIARSVDEASGKAKTSFETGEYMNLEISWEKNREVDAVLVDVFKNSGEHMTGFKSIKDGIGPIGLKTFARIHLNLMFAPGSYHFQISLRDKNDKEIKTAYHVNQFTIIKNWSRANRAWSGLMPVEHEWVEVS